MRAFTFGRTDAAVLSVGLLTTVFTPAQAAPAAIPPGVVEMTSVCPAGQLPKTVYSHENFETSFPNGDINLPSSGRLARVHPLHPLGQLVNPGRPDVAP